MPVAVSIPGLDLEGCCGAHIGCPFARAVNYAVLGRGQPRQHLDLVGRLCHMLIHVCRQKRLVGKELRVASVIMMCRGQARQSMIDRGQLLMVFLSACHNQK